VANHRDPQGHYHQLGLEPGATAQEIRRAYRRLAQKYHPDKNPGDPIAAEAFKWLQASYEALSGATADAAYLRTASAPEPAVRPEHTSSVSATDSLDHPASRLVLVVGSALIVAVGVGLFIAFGRGGHTDKSPAVVSPVSTSASSQQEPTPGLPTATAPAIASSASHSVYANPDAPLEGYDPSVVSKCLRDHGADVTVAPDTSLIHQYISGPVYLVPRTYTNERKISAGGILGFAATGREVQQFVPFLRKTLKKVDRHTVIEVHGNVVEAWTPPPSNEERQVVDACTAPGETPSSQPLPASSTPRVSPGRSERTLPLRP